MVDENPVGVVPDRPEAAMAAIPPLIAMTALLTGCVDRRGMTSSAHGDSAARDSRGPGPTAPIDPDFNGDGALAILLLGTSQSIDGRSSFSPGPVAAALEVLFTADETAPDSLMIVAEDIHATRDVTIGLGGAGNEYTYTHHRHSLAQYYHWPDGQAERMERLSGRGDISWDHVVIAADPAIVADMPGFFALGAHRIAARVAAGGAQPLLLVTWPQEGGSSGSIEHFADVTYRVAGGASVEVQTVPAGLAWAALREEERDASSSHPSEVGAQLAAATIYSQITQREAVGGDARLSGLAHTVVLEAQTTAHPRGEPDLASPVRGCGVSELALTYNHTGSSSENGILAGLRWVFEQAPQSLETGTGALITFNYGRANSNFEPEKRYTVDPGRFRFSFGFPMQDHGNHGDTSMLYGLDRRDSGVINDTDLGVAQHMIDQGELPHARAIPIRTLFAEMKERNPQQSAYRDMWHMHRDLDKAIGGYMHTLLTGGCALGTEPDDPASDAWNTWMAHKVGCDTAWTLMHLDANSPF
ncbi:MAG: hypothetical protein VX000_02850 [Myxococcota bacterium]|nr:hypothetical protein [Myxococcota bacterium]